MTEERRLARNAYARKWHKRYKETHGIASTTAYRRANPVAAARHRLTEKTRWQTSETVQALHRLRCLRYRKEEKLRCYSAYGGAVCACCGETTLEFLSLDHTNNDGAKQRRLLKYHGSGHAFYVWLRKHGYPEGYQVLCMNCNFGKRMNGGVCPHVEDWA